MPETACLHIQARDSDQIRVVELPGVSVRIGRASYCEVRLPEPELADEECHLRRRGATWHLIPVASPGAVTIEGRPLDRPRPLPYGVALQVGGHSLTLRPVGAAPPEWGTQRPSHPIEAPIVPRVAAGPLRPARAPATADPPGDRQPRPDLRAGRLTPEPEQKRWEARWKAAGERLKASATVAPPPPSAPQPVPPAPEPARASTRPSGWQGADLPRRETAPARKFTRPLEPATFPPVEPSLTNIPALKRVERPVPTRAPRVPTVARIVEPPAASVLVEPEPSPPSVSVHEADPAGRVSAAQPATEPTQPPAGWVSAAQPATDLPQPALEADVPIPPSAPEPAPSTSEWEEARGAIARKRLRNRGRSSQAGATPVLGTIRTLGTAIRTPASGRARSPEAPKRNVAAPPDHDEPPMPRSPIEVGPGPVPPVSREPSVAALANPVVPSGAWQGTTGSQWVSDSFQTPFVTDTHRTDLGGWTGPTPALEPPVAPEPEWPSARDILAAHGPRVSPRRESTTRDAPRPAPEGRRPLPTPGREPAQWVVPGWTVWLPLLALTVFGATAGVSLAWAWGQDDREAGLAANYVAAGLPGAKLPHGSDLIPDTRWTRATGANLARRAVALEFSGAEAEHRDQVETLLRAATLASPLEPTARFALARLGVDRGPPGAAEGQAPARGLGLGRDVVTLTFTARTLLKAGKTEAALRTYRAALDLATRAEPSQLAPPEYNDDDGVRRYALPGEDLIGLATRALIEQTDSSFTEWSPALHDSPVAALVAARALRDRSRIDADAALDIVLARTDGDALGLAARAEAHALKAEWSQAETLYRAAIDAMPIDRVRRAWLVNLADIEHRLNDDAQRQKALEAAKTIDPNDEITRRVVELQKSSGDRGEPPRDRATPRVTTTR